MYGVKYKVPFKTLSDRDSVVSLEERGYTGSVIELIAGGTPLVINIDQSDLLTPIRSSTATLAVVGSDYLQDLYANDPQGIRVKYEEDGVVKWLGYLLPDTFAQDFSSSEFVYEVELVAALSTLKYREFDLTDDFVTFRQIIEKAVEYSGYEAIYLTNSVGTKTGKFYDLKISSANFFDELGEASTYYEALEEIAKYLGCCFVPHEDDLYLLDYQAIRSGYNSYTRIVGGSVSNVTLQDLKEVKNYKGTGTKLSRIAGKNKASVLCSLYTITDILPTFDDEKSEFVDMKDEFLDIKNVMELNADYKAIIRYFNQPKYTLWKYSNGDPSSPFESPAPIIKGYDEPINSGNTGTSFVKTTEYLVDEIPSVLSFSNELQVKRARGYDEAIAGKILKSGQKIFSMKSSKRFLLHSRVWFCISLELKRMFEDWTKYDATLKVSDEYVIQQKASFRIGNYYYNGTTWVNGESSFLMPITVREGSKTLNQYYFLDNTNTFDKGLGDLQGYTFKAPNFPLMGDCELTLYAIDNVADFRPTSPSRVDKFHYYKNIKVAYGIPDMQTVYDDWVDKDNKNDILYENVIDEGYVEEADEIDLKICTNTDGGLALSSVLEGNDFLSEIRTDVFGTGVAEEILLQRVVSLFSKPRFNINPILENNAKPYSKFTEPHLNKQFLVAGGEEDVKMETMQYNLIEA